MKLSRRAATALALIVAVGLSGCGGSGATGELAKTKSQTQLVRNEAAHRLIGGPNEIVAEQHDSSTACKDKSDDPKGLYRAWDSNLLAVVLAESSVGVDQLAGALATSFSEDGWTFTEDNSKPDVKITTMTRTDSIVTLSLTSTEDSGNGASVYIEAVGPCVLTQGPNSDEVKNLEKK